MGRIKTTLIKKSAIELVKSHPTKLTKIYEENKISMKPFVKTQSIKLRNAIIGYATHIVKMKKLE